ncbi:Rne/Rng family ribonuclease [Roseicitreum antarcticum]|uniref:Ribonuclease E n=1 Tax=Roseicitreum antarcticum TaxID=564137 RepID=A0A1H2ZPT4_9RHOB|nr:ribonuclease E/G [Roseicitreum antarcticum]SDX19395.1 RNAse E [Roseicitreum antarcticum]
MANKMLIDATHAEETRVVVVNGTKVEEFDFETANRRQLAGNIYLAKVTRVEPSLQAAFVDYGGNRHGFLAFNEIHPDYYQIPTADRQALLAEERELARAQDEEEAKPRRSVQRRRSRPKAEAVGDADAVDTREINGMDIIDLEGDAASAVDGAPQSAADTAASDQPDTDYPDAPDAEAEAPYVAADHATENDDQIESVADDDVSDEVRPPRKARAKRYKIQEVVKVRQIMLVQVVKEERGNKGAALTTYLSLAGRYCVLMPNTARGGGISRKITNVADRKKLKDIASTIEVPEGAGLIIRTAGSQRTKPEIKRDYEYLFRLWEQIRELTLKSIAPAPIYAEGDLIKRTIRDLYSRDIEEVLVEGVEGYRTAKDFMKMIMPSHAKNVKQYTDTMPLFARHQVESYLSGMFNPTVQLKSGGYIVIGITEALVAIDINSGRATKEGSIEETALKTNLEAAEEIARQLRLRDLAGLIVIDFIDMEERRNNAAVEKMLKDKLKTDRARIQVGRISGFGLLEMSRQRLRPGMLEATTQPCPHCHGTGLIRSDDSLGLSILRQLEEEGTRNRSREVLVKAPVGIVNFLMNQKREHIAQIELRYGMAIRLEADPMLVSPDFVMEKFKTATRVVAPVAPAVVSVDMTDMPELDEDDIADDVADEDEAQPAAAQPAAQPAARAENGDEGPRKKRRRRRRRRGANGGDEGSSDQNTADHNTQDAADGAEQPQPAAAAAPEAAPAAAADDNAAVTAAVDAEVGADTDAKPARKRVRKRKPAGAVADAGADAPNAADAPSAPADAPAATDAAPAAAPEAAEKPKPKPRRSRKKPVAAEDAVAAETPVAVNAPVTEVTVSPTESDTAQAEVAAVADVSNLAVATDAVDAQVAPTAAEPVVADTAPQQIVAAAFEPAQAETLVQREVVGQSQPDGDAEPSVAAPASPAPEAAAPENPSEAETADASGRDETATDDAGTNEAGTDDTGTAKPRKRGWWSLGR